jgi:uncharacterized DUF497 family protein
MCTIRTVEVEWDPRKAASNLRKHGIAFSDAVGVLEDPYAVTIRDEHEEEERWVTIGCDFLGRLLVVVHTQRDEAIRIISARKANRSERDQYEEDPSS